MRTFYWYRLLNHNIRNLDFRYVRPIHKNSKRLPLETEDTQKNEYRRLGSIKTLHIQISSLQGCIRRLKSAEAVFNCQSNQ